MESSSLHGYEWGGYAIEGSIIRFALAEPSPVETSPVEVVFRDVEGYFFERNLPASVVLAVEEQPLADFLERNEAHFAREARWGWPRFWQGSAARTAEWLAVRRRHAWTVATSHGLSGWIVAGGAAYHNAVRRSAGSPLALAAWRTSSNWPR